MPTTWGTASSTRVKSGRISSSVPESRFMNRHSRPSGNWLQNWTWPGVSPVNCELEVIVGDETGFKRLETAGTYTLAPVLMRRDAVQSSNLLASPMIALSPFGFGVDSSTLGESCTSWRRGFCSSTIQFRFHRTRSAILLLSSVRDIYFYLIPTCASSARLRHLTAERTSNV